MTDGQAKVLTGLMERRALEAAFSDLAGITDPERQAAAAAEIAGHGRAALTALLALLDTGDPQLRGGLGEVARRLPRAEVVPALQNAARAPGRSDAARLSALTILDRYLAEPVDESLLTGLQDPDGVAVRSLRELVSEMERDPMAIIEYLGQLAEQPPEVARMILDAVPLLSPDPHLVTLLRVFAQDPDRSLAQAALAQLGRTRTPEAVQALTSLAQTLPPAAAALANRMARKLRLGGTAEPALRCSEASWRALLSPVDGEGTQIAWFMGAPSDGRGCPSFTVVWSDPEGIIACLGTASVPETSLPRPAGPGALHLVERDDGLPPLTLLEVPFAVGRRAVQQALQLNWSSERWPPLAYRLFGGMLWPTEETAEPTPSPAETGLSAAGSGSALLDHPVLASWFLRGPAVQRAARLLGPRHGLAERTAAVDALAASEFNPEVLASYARRLEVAAGWFDQAYETAAAALARSVAAQLAACRPGDAPFVRRLIGIGLDVAIAVPATIS